MGKIKIFLFVLIPVAIEGIKSFLLGQNYIIFTGHSNDYKQTLIHIRNKQPDILIIDDTCLETKKLFQFITDILNCEWKKKIILYTSSNNPIYLRMLSDAGIKSIVHKTSSQDIFLEACEVVNITGGYIDQTIASVMLKQNLSSRDDLENQISKLSKRELEILDLFSLGMNNKEIADKLFISYRTLEKHKSNITKKLGLKGRRELYKYLLSVPKEFLI